jgi:hypothetical protein
LKAVIEHEDIGLKRLNCPACGANAVSIADYCGPAAEVLGQQKRLIARGENVAKYSLSV